jgi:hypothetical protein
MNNYEALNKLGDVIAELTAIYRNIAEDLPKLHFVGEIVPNDNAKKMPQTLFVT